MTAASAVDRGPGARVLLARGVGRWALGAAVLVTVFWHGGVGHTAVGVALLLVAIGWLANAVDPPHRAPGSRMGWLWVGLGLYTAAQLVPLPRDLVLLLHPFAVEVSDRGRAALGLAPASAIPIAVATGDAAFQGVVYLLAGIFSVTAGASVTHHGGRAGTAGVLRAMVWTALVSGLMWLVGYGHGIAWRMPPGVREVGRLLSFRDSNHEAGVLVMAIATAFASAMRRAALGADLWRMAAALAAGICLFTGSRGGIVAAVFVVVLGLLASPPAKAERRSARQRAEQTLTRVVLATLSTALVLVIVALPVLEFELDLDSGRGSDTSKLEVLGKVPDLLGEGWLFGRGPGTVPVALAAAPLAPGSALGPPKQPRVDFLENIVADRLVSGGLWGGGGFLVALAWIIGWLLVRRRRRQWIPPALACAGLLLQNLVDFSLEVSGALMMFMVAATCAERLLPHRGPGPRDGQRPARASARRAHRGRVLLSGGALVIATLLWQGSRGHLTRDVDRRYPDLPTPALHELVAKHFLYDHHALYVLGRRLLDEGRLEAAEHALDAALALRPGSRHARLARVLVRRARGRVEGAADDAVLLLNGDWASEVYRPSVRQALEVLTHIDGGGDVLEAAIGRLADRSWPIAIWLEHLKRPDLVERLAIKLRHDYPDRRFGIESVRAKLYVRRGLFKPASRIAAVLMADPRTELGGWSVQAWILAATGHPYQAHHLFDEVCRRRPNPEACDAAVQQIVVAHRPDEAIDYLQGRYPDMRKTERTAYLYWASMAHVLHQQGELDEAVNAAQRALGFRRDDRAALTLLTRLFIELGDAHGAENSLARMRAALQGKAADAAIVDLTDEVTRLSRKPTLQR